MWHIPNNQMVFMLLKMPKYCSLKETWVSYKLVFVSKDKSVLNILREIKKSSKFRKTKKLWYQFLTFFQSQCQKFIFAGETGDQAMGPCSFEILLIFPYFLRSYEEPMFLSLKSLFNLCGNSYINFPVLQSWP